MEYYDSRCRSDVVLFSAECVCLKLIFQIWLDCHTVILNTCIYDFAARCYASAVLAVMRCLYVCVCVSVTFVDCFKTNKRIFKIFSPSGSHTILVFLHQIAWQYSDGNPPNRDVECRLRRQKSGFSASIWLHRMLWTLRRASCYQHDCRPISGYRSLTAGASAINWRSSV